MNVCNINGSASGNTIITTIFVGVNEKKYITFNMEKEELEKVIKQYFVKTNNTDEENIKIASVYQKLLKK